MHFSSSSSSSFFCAVGDFIAFWGRLLKVKGALAGITKLDKYCTFNLSPDPGSSRMGFIGWIECLNDEETVPAREYSRQQPWLSA